MSADWMRQLQPERGVWGIHLLTFIPACFVFPASPRPPKDSRVGEAAWTGPLRTANGLHLQIFFCKYYIMFLTQQVPRAVQRAL